MANEKTRLPVWLKIISGVLIALNVVIIIAAVFLNVNCKIAENKGVLPKLFSYNYTYVYKDEILPKYENGSLLLAKPLSSYQENEEVIILNSADFENQHIIENRFALAKISEISEEKINLRLFPQEDVEAALGKDEIVGSVQYIIPFWGSVAAISTELVGLLLFILLPAVLIAIIAVVLVIVKKKRMRKYNEFSLDYDDGDEPIVKLPMPDFSESSDDYDLFKPEEAVDNSHEKLDFIPLNTTTFGSDFYNLNGGETEEKEETVALKEEQKEIPAKPALQEEAPAEIAEDIAPEALKQAVLFAENSEKAPTVTFEEGDEVVAIYDDERCGRSYNEFAPSYLKLFERQTLEEFKHSLNRTEDKYSMILKEEDLSSLDDKTKSRLRKLDSFDADFVMDKLNERARFYDEAEETTAEEDIAEAYQAIEAMTETVEEEASITEEAPVEETPTEPINEPVIEEIPVEEIPTEVIVESVIEETPVEETQAEVIAEPVIEEIPVEEIPTEVIVESVIEETPVEETPAEVIAKPVIEEIPVEEIPTEVIVESVFEETLVEETPTEPIIEPAFEETPVEETIEEEEPIAPINIKEIALSMDAPIEDIDSVYDYPSTPVAEEIAPVIVEAELTPAEIHELEMRAQKAKRDVLISNMARMYYDINLANYND